MTRWATTALDAPAQAPTRRSLADVPPDAQQFAVRMRDGVLLATDVYLPPGTGPWPVLVARMPYDKAGDECFMPDVARWFVRKSYAVVVQDVRGKARSGGEFVPFETETADGYDTMEWAMNQGWSNGAIGMIGDSYYGFTQWAAAASGHPALRAITPRACGTDFQAGLKAGGVLQLESLICWSAETWIDDGLYDAEQRLDWSTRPLSDVIPRALAGLRSSGLDDLVLHGPRAAASVAATGAVPALHLGGFADVMLDAQLDAWREAGKGGAHQYLVLDHTDHAWTPLREPGVAYEEPTADPRALARFLDAYLGPLLPFLDHFVSGTGAYEEAPVRWRAGRDNTWREASEWPPTTSRAITWHLAPRLLDDQPSSTPVPVKWTHDPNDPVPSHAHPYYQQLAPVDESVNLDREDVLAFSTAMFDLDLLLCGPVRLNGQLSSEGSDTYLMATLYDWFEDGTCHRITDGASRVEGPWPAACHVVLRDAGYRVRAGHRLVLTVSSSSFPRYALHPGTAEHPWTATTTATTQQALWLGGADGASLTCRFEPEETP